MRLLVFAFTLLWPSLVLADQPRPILPALYQVTGVAENDVLNVRAAPDAAATMIDGFVHNARDIQVIELSLSGRWALVNTDEQAGWVAFRYLERQAEETGFAGLPASLYCFGNERFWNLRLTADGLTLARPEGQDTYPITFAAPSVEHVALGESGFLFTWMAGNQPVRAHILPGRCSDGMSDLAYGLHYVDTYLMNSGCCSL